MLDTEGPTPVLGSSSKERFYDRVLRNADFTHALFSSLADDFNGDLFALGEARDKRFQDAALRLLRDFLLGEIQADQRPLFFWAYDFEVVPLALISSIYEQFYHDSRSSDPSELAPGEDPIGAEVDEESNSFPYVEEEVAQAMGSRQTAEEENLSAGTHYTPANLVHDVLRRTLTPACLALQPKVLDPACGSGIFLVEAFRRIVRFESQSIKRKLLPSELRNILRHRIVGVEINAEAARVAAFSLYLALLDQQEPPDILVGAPLPYLIFREGRDEEQYGILLISDAFALTANERQKLTERLTTKTYKGRADDVKLLEIGGELNLPLGEFDVVVGNPPWQEAPSKMSVPRLWAVSFKLPAGEESYSQLFIHRALAMLRPGGILGLLIGMKVFWNDRDTSRAFRRHLLTRATLKQVVNMAHVRRIFFAKAVAPFAFLLAENRIPSDQRVVLWNARRVRTAELLRSMSVVPLDRRVVPQRDLVEADHLWKVYWWGGHHDAALVCRLGLERTLGEAVEGVEPKPSYGWQRGKNSPLGKVAVLNELSNTKVQPFGPLRDTWFISPPAGTKRDPDQRIYGGQRLVITHGVREPTGPVARLETREFTFRHSFYCIPLPHLSEDKAKLALGVLWSSLGRYILFMTAGSWGGWHDKVTARDLLRLPVRLTASWGMLKAKHDNAAARVAKAVDALRKGEIPFHLNLFQQKLLNPYEPGAPEYNTLRQLDIAIFDLFEMSQSERDLVEDFWAESHDLYWKGADSAAAKPLPLPELMHGTRADLAENPARDDLQRYLAAFLDAWNPHLPDRAELVWQVAMSPRRDAISIAFFPTGSDNTVHAQPSSDWNSLVARCASVLPQPVSPAFHTKRVICAATADGFVVLKENARRLWTASTAREDAEALFVQLDSRRKG